MPDQPKWKDAPTANKVIAVFVVALPLFFVWRCASAVSDYDPPERSRPTPAEQREVEQAKRTVETACALWWDGALDLPDDQARVCVDGGYGK